MPKTVLFIGLNPSVADGATSDPTSRREMAFAHDWGFTRYLKGNVLDWRATRPRDLPRAPHEARSARNVPVLLGLAFEADAILLATGNVPPAFAALEEETRETLRAVCLPLMCLGQTKRGYARHTLYLPRAARPVAFEAPPPG